MKIDEKRVASIMKNLGCTREEALEVIREDDEIDGMTMKEINADLTPEQKKAMKDATKTGTKKRTAVKRERKVDTDKLEILQVCDDALCDLVDNVCERTTETELHFTYNGASYTLKLIKHRPPKA